MKCPAAPARRKAVSPAQRRSLPSPLRPEVRVRVKIAGVLHSHRPCYEVDPGKSGLRLGQAVRAEGSASDVRVIAVRLVYMRSFP